MTVKALNLHHVPDAEEEMPKVDRPWQTHKDWDLPDLPESEYFFEVKEYFITFFFIQFCVL